MRPWIRATSAKVERSWAAIVIIPPHGRQLEASCGQVGRDGDAAGVLLSTGSQHAVHAPCLYTAMDDGKRNDEEPAGTLTTSTSTGGAGPARVSPTRPSRDRSGLASPSGAASSS